MLSKTSEKYCDAFIVFYNDRIYIHVYINILRANLKWCLRFIFLGRGRGGVDGEGVVTKMSSLFIISSPAPFFNDFFSKNNKGASATVYDNKYEHWISCFLRIMYRLSSLSKCFSFSLFFSRVLHFSGFLYFGTEECIKTCYYSDEFFDSRRKFL